MAEMKCPCGATIETEKQDREFPGSNFYYCANCETRIIKSVAGREGKETHVE